MRVYGRDEPVYTTGTKIPCGPDCAERAHLQATCTRCQEPFDHRVLIETDRAFVCPPCSEVRIREAKFRSNDQVTASFVFLLAMTFFASLCMGCLGIGPFAGLASYGGTQ